MINVCGDLNHRLDPGIFKEFLIIALLISKIELYLYC